MTGDRRHRLLAASASTRDKKDRRLVGGLLCQLGVRQARIDLDQIAVGIRQPKLMQRRSLPRGTRRFFDMRVPGRSCRASPSAIWLRAELATQRNRMRFTASLLPAELIGQGYAVRCSPAFIVTSAPLRATPSDWRTRASDRSATLPADSDHIPPHSSHSGRRTSAKPSSSITTPLISFSARPPCSCSLDMRSVTTAAASRRLSSSM